MQVLFISRQRPNFDIMPFIKSQADSLVSNGVDIVHFTIKRKGLRGYLKTIPELKAVLRSSKFDLIHAHYSYSALLALLTFSGIPLVVSFMGADVYGSKGLGGDQPLKRFADVLLAKLLQIPVNQIIVKSKNLYDAIYLKKKTSIIPNGVNFEKFAPRDRSEAKNSLGISGDKKALLFLGHPTYPRKNFELLQKAFDHLKNDQWQIVNPYPTAPENIPTYINAADVLVLTSLQEGSPNVIKEAMACNCPIVTTNVGDVEEVISKTEGCYLCSYEYRDVAEKIQLALQFDSTTGRRDIDHLEINKVAQSIISVYKQALNIS